MIVLGCRRLVKVTTVISVVQYNLNRSRFVRIFVEGGCRSRRRCRLGTGYPQRPASHTAHRNCRIATRHFWQVSVILLVQTRVNLWDQSVPDRWSTSWSTESQARFKSASGCPE